MSRVVVLIALVAAALAAFGGYEIGSGTATELGPARAAGTRAGVREGRALGEKDGYRRGYAAGRREAFDDARDGAYAEAYRREFTRRGLPAPAAAPPGGSHRGSSPP